jgi:hypothetical protein
MGEDVRRRYLRPIGEATCFVWGEGGVKVNEKQLS